MIVGYHRRYETSGDPRQPDFCYGWRPPPLCHSCSSRPAWCLPCVGNQMGVTTSCTVPTCQPHATTCPPSMASCWARHRRHRHSEENRSEERRVGRECEAEVLV